MQNTEGRPLALRVIVGVILGLLWLGAAGLVFFFARMVQNDMRALEDFQTAYQIYDQAISNLGTSAISEEAIQNVENTLAGLKDRSAFRLSSLIKNEQQAMSAARQIADLAGLETTAWLAYQQAASHQNAGRDQLSKELEAVSAQRRAAYASFLELGK